MGRPKKFFSGSGTQSTVKKISALPDSFDVNTGTDLFWDALLKRFSKIARVYGFSRVETPAVEDARLFKAFYGQNSAKYDSLVVLPWHGLLEAALRPTQLPGILRNFSHQKFEDAPSLHKWHYGGFTYKKDFAGKPFLDYELGCEILGQFNHLNEAQVIAAAWEFFSGFELEGLILEINNLGSQECQERYAGVLVDALLPKKYDLCDNCNELLTYRPLGVFACENLDCQAAAAESPTILDFLDQDSHKDFTNVLEALDEMNIIYQLNPFYVGKQSSEKTTFSVKYKFGEKMVSLVEGGYHQSSGYGSFNKNFAAFGFFGSLMLLKKILKDGPLVVERQILSEVCLVPLGELAAKRSLRLFRDLTAHKILVYDHFGLSGVKNQLKVALDNKVPIALIMGQKEAMDEMVILRDVKSGMQEIISYDKIVEEVKKRLGK
ncbi:MAG: ATP phosphoribosyltransferase regulatory subunit [Patescibacteria group bacterium]